MPHADELICRIALPWIAELYDFAHHARECGADDGECPSDRSANIYGFSQDDAEVKNSRVLIPTSRPWVSKGPGTPDAPHGEMSARLSLHSVRGTHLPNTKPLKVDENHGVLSTMTTEKLRIVSEQGAMDPVCLSWFLTRDWSRQPDLCPGMKHPGQLGWVGCLKQMAP